MPVHFDCDSTVPALIFKIGSYPLHRGMLGIIRSLGRLGVPVYAVVEDRFCPGARSRYICGTFQRNTGNADPVSCLADLVCIHEWLGRSAILLATDDKAAVFLAENARSLTGKYLLPRIPCHLPRQLSDKRSLYSLCAELAVPFAQTVFPECLEDVQKFADQTTFPVIAKASPSQALPKGFRSTYILHSPLELLSLYQEAKLLGVSNLILQIYIPPDCGEDWIVHGYYNPETGCTVSFTGKKLRSFPHASGFTTLGIPSQNDALSKQAERLLHQVGYAGVFDMDYRLDHRDGEYKLLDFNPRIGANFRMFENSAGIDVARALYLDLTGKSVPCPAMKQDRVFIVEPYDVMTSITYIREKELTIPRWWRTLQGRRELAWFSVDDPFPSFVMWFRLFGCVVAKLARQIARPVLRTRALALCR